MQNTNLNMLLETNEDSTEITVTLKSNDFIDPVQTAMGLMRLGYEVLASATGVTDAATMTDELGPYEGGKKMGEA